MTRYEKQTIWLYTAVSLSIICFACFAMSMYFITISEVVGLSSQLEIMMLRLVSAVIGMKLVGFSFWIYQKREKELWR